MQPFVKKNCPPLLGQEIRLLPTSRKKTLWQEAAHFFINPPLQKQFDRFEGKNSVQIVMYPLGTHHPWWGKTDRYWSYGHLDGHIFEKHIFQNPVPQIKSINKRVRKNTRAFCRRVAKKGNSCCFPARSRNSSKTKSYSPLPCTLNRICFLHFWGGARGRGMKKNPMKSCF